MASTSTSSFQKSFKYDVFLSFRGEDTRHKFVSHLYKALEQHGIRTYKDDEKIEKGETIDTQLIKSIEDSRFFIIVFSKDYAGSSWCLDELVKIMECRKASEQTAYPVFYDVEPTEIRRQSGTVGEAFKKHENKEGAGKWRKALNEAGNLAGWESKTTANGDESELIQKIVDVIFKKKCSSSSSVDGNLVGMETRVEAVLSSLALDDDDVCMIGIWGMGGGGKTTLAKAVFDRISIQFDGTAFVENVRKVSESILYGLSKLQQQILRSVLSDENITVRSVHEGTNMMKTLLRGRKVLVVLDDVDDREQLEALAGEPNDWFELGSRVIITTRDKQVLSAHEVKFIDVNLLSHAEAICLLSKHAFKRDIPIEEYEELSKQVVKYADGLPLTIKVLGSFLRGLNVPEWKDTLNKLKKIPLEKTMEKLEISYDGLEPHYKEIFLDVACLLKGWHIEDAIRSLESCGFFAKVGLRVLEQRSLINISERGELGMHDHIEEMGKNIVRRLHPDNPEKHSRLWIREEILDILANESGTQATKCITLAHGFNLKILMNGLANMKELRFLQLYEGEIEEESEEESEEEIEEESEAEVSNRNFDEDSLHLPNALRFLSWHRYPFSSLPKTFQAKNLVGLEMDCSSIVQLWKDGEEKACLKLRFLKFTSSHYLRTLDLSVAPNLETLILFNCNNLVEVHFQVTPNLKELRIKYCESLEKLHMPAESPELRSLNLDTSSKLRTLHLGKTPNLETLNLYECTDMVELCMPAESPKLRSLNLEKSKLTTLHLGKTPNLETLILQDCTDMDELRMPTECPKLVTLDLYEVKLRTKLQTLHLRITPNLETVMLSRCTGLVELRIPAESPKLEKLSLSCCTDMVELHMPAEYTKLVDLHLHNLRELRTLHLGITPNLEKLVLGHCPDMVEFCMLAECPKLVDLYLYCLKLTTHQILEFLAKCPNLVNLELSNLELTSLHLGTTPNLEKLSLSSCPHVVELHITECPKLVTLQLNNIVKLRTLDLGLTPNLESLDLYSCYDLEEINAPAERLKKLLHLGIRNCGMFKYFKFDKELTLDGGILEAPKDLYQLEWLEELRLGSEDIKSLPDSLCMLKHLKSLEISCRLLEKLPEDIGRLHYLKSLGIFSCHLLEKLPEDIGGLQCLEKLILIDCRSLRVIPNSICEMHCLECLYLTDCIRIEELPEEIGRLECLKKLDIRGTGITCLPKSIYQLKGLCIMDDDDFINHDDDDDDDDEDDDDDDEDDEDNDDDARMLMGMLMI